MNAEQLLSVGVIIAMMAVFVWGRFRYDIVAVGALLVGIAVGIVPLDGAFTGFSNDIVIIVGSALLISAGVARSASPNSPSSASRQTFPACGPSSPCWWWWSA